MSSRLFTRSANCIRHAIVSRVVRSLVWLVARFRPIYEFVDVEYQTAPDGTEVEVEAKTPAVFAQAFSNTSLLHVAAWIERDGPEDCLKVHLLGYGIEIFYSKARCAARHA